MLKLVTLPKSWLQNSIFRQETQRNILLNKLNKCKGEGEIHPVNTEVIYIKFIFDM